MVTRKSVSTSESDILDAVYEALDDTEQETPAPKPLYLLKAPVFYFGLYQAHNERPCYQTGNERMQTFKRWGDETVEFYQAKQVEVVFKDRFTAWVNPEFLEPATGESILAAIEKWKQVDAKTPAHCRRNNGSIDRKLQGNWIASVRRRAQAAAQAASA